MLSPTLAPWEGYQSLASLLVINLAVQCFGWAIACYWRTERFYDVTGSATFILLTSLCLSWHPLVHLRQTVQSTAVIVWAVRLGLFLFLRIGGSGGQDRRFNNIRDARLKFFAVWMMQGAWVMTSLLPSLLCISSSKQPRLCNRDYIGWGMWLMGFIIETVADYQKTAFRSDTNNKDKFIRTGLWSLSRHPNYFGEILLWFGLYVSASSTFVSYQYFSVVCPTLVYLLITKVSGIPMLESYARKKWGNSPEYKAYIIKTPLLVPFWQ